MKTQFITPQNIKNQNLIDNISAAKKRKKGSTSLPLANLFSMPVDLEYKPVIAPQAHPKAEKEKTETPFALEAAMLDFEGQILKCQLGEMKLDELYEEFEALQAKVSKCFQHIKRIRENSH